MCLGKNLFGGKHLGWETEAKNIRVNDKIHKFEEIKSL